MTPVDFTNLASWYLRRDFGLPITPTWKTQMFKVSEGIVEGYN